MLYKGTQQPWMKSKANCLSWLWQSLTRSQQTKTKKPKCQENRWQKNKDNKEEQKRAYYNGMKPLGQFLRPARTLCQPCHNKERWLGLGMLLVNTFPWPQQGGIVRWSSDAIARMDNAVEALIAETEIGSAKCNTFQNPEKCSSMLQQRLTSLTLAMR